MAGLLRAHTRTPAAATRLAEPAPTHNDEAGMDKTQSQHRGSTPERAVPRPRSRAAGTNVTHEVHSNLQVHTKAHCTSNHQSNNKASQSRKRTMISSC